MFPVIARPGTLVKLTRRIAPLASRCEGAADEAGERSSAVVAQQEPDSPRRHGWSAGTRRACGRRGRERARPAESPRPTCARRRPAERRARTSCTSPAGCRRRASAHRVGRAGRVVEHRVAGARDDEDVALREARRRSFTPYRGRRADVAVAGEDEHRHVRERSRRRARRRPTVRASRRRAKRCWSGAPRYRRPGRRPAVERRPRRQRRLARVRGSFGRHGNGPSPQFVARRSDDVDVALAGRVEDGVEADQPLKRDR